MVDFVINDRRREPRSAASARLQDRPPQIPGSRVLEVIDFSAHGMRCRLAGPVRPGRPLTLRMSDVVSRPVVTALVIRCEVCRLTRQSVQYDAAWAVEQPWRHE